MNDREGRIADAVEPEIRHWSNSAQIMTVCFAAMLGVGTTALNPKRLWIMESTEINPAVFEHDRASEPVLGQIKGGTLLLACRAVLGSGVR